MSSTLNRYFDNATTSFPKPPEVATAIYDYITDCSGSYGRASYDRIVKSTTIVERCRDFLAEMLGVSTPENIFFTQSATMGANTLLQGMDLEGKTVYVSPMEHNAVMRPLQYLSETKGIAIKILPHNNDGSINFLQLEKSINKAALIIINHQSNVNGGVQQIAKIREAFTDTPILLDLSQSLGYEKIELDKWSVDYAFFTGHKSLLATNGIGGFWARTPQNINPLLYGGTGSKSDSYDMPESFPDRFEAGTHNVTGITGLLAAIENRPTPNHTRQEFLQFLQNISAIKELKIYCSSDPERQGELFSITHRNISPSELCQKLYSEFGIETRQGLRCSPLAHRTLGTFPTGTVRVSVSPYHTVADFNYFINSLLNV